ncbi:PREDICTED: organic cation transporter protein-like isoform X2 [Nicrophorus vespilloides]|nr:PREDICTED: organic cation transporter protein-like isoform X2 [Nicrophorus vespilloides]XP_017774916.1 PREDICTED: organic cation transporter protein-like isoform X2 [Nicrophorus vespilloides]
MPSLDLDDILTELGHFGTFQKRNYLLICLVIAFSVLPLGYVFTTRSSKYRCFIEECDGDTASAYEQDWLQDAIPLKETELSRCERFAPGNASDSACSNFDRGNAITCDRFIFENGDLTIERDFNVTCDENLWMLTIVGSINNIGELVCLPLSGYISDKYGRRSMMVISALLSTFCGLMKSFSWNYITYVVMEFLDTSLGSGTYTAAYILAIEIVVPEQRVLGNTLVACAFALGEALLGAVAWMSPSWRWMMRFLYTPGVLITLYFWCVPESVRWLLSKGRWEEGRDVLRKVAKANGTRIPDETLQQLGIRKDDPEDEEKQGESIRSALRSPVLLFRLINCSFAWCCCTFVYYGLTMHSVSISGNLYSNFIAVAFIEMPAYLVSYCTLDKIGRKSSLAGSLMASGAACTAFIFIPEANAVCKLIAFLFGKFSITIAYTTLYIYTTEMFPTNLRHSLLAVCSMFGRLGSMVAPQIPLLARISPTLPLIMFGVMASASGLLSLLFPETLNTKLPDTISEAVHIQKE